MFHSNQQVICSSSNKSEANSPSQEKTKCPSLFAIIFGLIKKIVYPIVVLVMLYYCGKIYNDYKEIPYIGKYLYGTVVSKPMARQLGL